LTAAALVLALLAPIAAEDAPRFDRLCAQVAASWDSARGGFVTRDGQPLESAVELAFVLGHDRADPLWTVRARQTVSWTLGLYDEAGGGYFQRRRDADPSKPSFEKRTDSNARRLENLIDAWLNGGDDEDRSAAARVVDYFDRVLLDARGGFVAGQVGDRDLVPEANGYAIHAWLRWAAATADPRVRDFAQKSLDRVWDSCWKEGLGMMQKGTFGELKGAPLLVDQSEMGRAYVLGAHIGGRQVDLERARTIGRLLLERFEDPAKGGFAEHALAAGEDKVKVKRGGREFDQNAHAVRFLAELASITGESKYRDAARRAVHAFEKDLGKAGAEAGDWALAVRSLLTPDLPPRLTWKQLAPKSLPRPTKVFRTKRRGGR
jgi:uncharacterized protein YyaL (SSP411 family)